MTYYRFLITRDGERFFTWQLSDLEGFRPNKRFQRVCAHTVQLLFFFRQTTRHVKNVHCDFFYSLQVILLVSLIFYLLLSTRLYTIYQCVKLMSK